MKKIRFSTLDEDGGIAFYPVTGAVIALEKEECNWQSRPVVQLSFYVIYRSSIDSPKIKASIKEFLLTLLESGLEQQTVVINGEQKRLEEYPVLTEERKIERL